MSLATTDGAGALWPKFTPITGALVTSLLADANGEKLAYNGQVWLPGRGTKSIRKVHFLTGTISLNAASQIRVSLQNTSTSATPLQPDGTQDEYDDMAGAELSSGAWHTTGNLSADRSVTHGDWLSVVWEFQTFNASDVFRVSGMGCGSIIGGATFAGSASLYTSSWATISALPNVIFEMTDGTFGTLSGAWPLSAYGELTFKQDSAIDENAIRIVPPWPMKADGAWFFGGATAATTDMELVLYDGTSAMTGGTVTLEGNQFYNAGESRLHTVLFSQEISLAKDGTYYLSLKPTQTTSNARLIYIDVNANGHLVCHSGTSIHRAYRADAGAWDVSSAGTTTRLPLMGLRISSLDDGISTDGGVTFARRSTLIGR